MSLLLALGPALLVDTVQELGEARLYKGMQFQFTGAAGTQSNTCWRSLEGAQERNLGTKEKGKVVKEIIHPIFYN